MRYFFRFFAFVVCFHWSVLLKAEEPSKTINMADLLNLLKKNPVGRTVIHIPQIHSAVHLGSSDTEDALNSQFHIAQAFLKIKESGYQPRVWQEGLPSTDPRIDKAEIKKAFPRGFPKSLKAFTKKQKDLLLKWDAPGILSGLDIIPAVSGAENRIASAALYDKIEKKVKETGITACDEVERIASDKGSSLEKELFFHREETALWLIETETPKDSISFLVYGRAHEFTKYNKNKFDDKNILRLELEP